MLSLLKNEQFMDFMHNHAVYNKWGGMWQCKQAKVLIKQITTTKGVFWLKCICGNIKL